MQQVPIVIYQDEDGVYMAECPLIQWFHTYGHNLEELYARIHEVQELYDDEIGQLQKKDMYNFVSVSFLPLQKSVHGTSHHKLKRAY